MLETLIQVSGPEYRLPVGTRGARWQLLYQKLLLQPVREVFFTIPGHLGSWSVALTHSVSYTFWFFFLSSSVTIFFSFYPVPRPFRELNWEIGHEAAILPSWMWEYSNPDPDLIKLPQKILSDIRTDSCLYSVGPSYKMTDRTAGPPVFDTSAGQLRFKVNCIFLLF